MIPLNYLYIVPCVQQKSQDQDHVLSRVVVEVANLWYGQEVGKYSKLGM